MTRKNEPILPRERKYPIQIKRQGMRPEFNADAETYAELEDFFDRITESRKNLYLTQREIEVAYLLIIDLKSSMEMAYILFISVKTVEAHRGHIIDKIDDRFSALRRRRSGIRWLIREFWWRQAPPDVRNIEMED